ncbi:DUF4232 domain-containing protein [Geodermatophilus sp. CPCC 206100]|uniref:DUF4232 domain-containing protein n=1 Tax=Geodermatophilus sp. CPCC 206100 TaxID=3020054 RepID=UPI003B008266
MAGRERVLRRCARIAGVLGWILLAGATWRSAWYRPGWFDPDDGPPCSRRLSGACSPADAEAALAHLWVWVAVGGGLVLAATALTVVLLPAVRATAPVRSLPVPLHAAAAGAAAALLCLGGSLPALFALLLGAHAAPAVVLGAWLAQAGLLALLDTRLGAPATSPRRAALTGLLVGAATTGLVLAALGAGRVQLGDWSTLAAGVGVLVALGVAVARWMPAGPGGASRRGAPARRGAAVAALALCAFLVLGGGGVLLRLGVGVLGADDPPLPEDPVAGAPPTTPAPLPSPVPLPPAPETPAPPSVEADVRCAQDQLDYTVVGFDAALGARAASVQARNTGDVPCWVQGVPVVTLLQGGRPLSLTVEPGRSPTGGPPSTERVGIAPGGTALALLTWRTYAGWADAATPQSVTVALDPSAEPGTAGVVGGPPGAPFDIADGGAWGIAPWAPPGN